MTAVGASKDQSDDRWKRLIDLIDYVEHMVLLSEKAVFALGEYRQLAYHEADLKGRTGILHDQTDEDGPIWLCIDRLKRADPPNIPEQIQSWITVAADPFTEPVVEDMRVETIPRLRAAEPRFLIVSIYSRPAGREIQRTVCTYEQ